MAHTVRLDDLVTHPEKFAVGKPVTITRRLSRSIAWRRDGVVVKHTATQVTVESGVGVYRFRERYGRYVLTPAYLDYDTVIEPQEEK